MKTRVIIGRARSLLEEGAKPESILLLTFTNHAAGVMKDRLQDIPGSEGVVATTFHSFCYRLLREVLPEGERNFTIVDEDDQEKIVKDLIVEARRVGGNLIIDADYINLQHSLGVAASLTGNRGFITYDRYLREHNLIDFGGLQVRALEHMHEVTNFKHVMVDEYHDTSPVQYLLVKTLEEFSKTLMLACDEMQSIYGWRGADVENIRQFIDDYPDTRIVKLERNYRSTGEIVRVVNNIASRCDVVAKKTLYTENRTGEKPRLVRAWNPDNEAEKVARRILDSEIPRDEHAVLFRTNSQSRPLEESFIRAGIPYKLVAAVSFYRRMEVKDFLAYLRYIYNPYDDVALKRIIGRPSRGIGKKTIERVIDEYGSFARGVTISDNPRFQCLRDMISHFMGKTNKMPIWNLAKEVLSYTGYREWLENYGKAEDSVRRLENLDSLLDSILDFQRRFKDNKLKDYLQVVSLVSDSDAMDDEEAVTLMSIHSSKGTEARCVHIIGLEDGILPHQRSIQEDNVEEERRLCYVALSRAGEELYVYYCQERVQFGRHKYCSPSRFLQEMRDN